MSKSKEIKHTAEPWDILISPCGYNVVKVINDHKVINIFWGAWSEQISKQLEQEESIRRAIACVNALAGLNPEAVGELIEDIKDLHSICKIIDGRLDIERIKALKKDSYILGAIHPDLKDRMEKIKDALSAVTSQPSKGE